MNEMVYLFNKNILLNYTVLEIITCDNGDPTWIKTSLSSKFKRKKYIEKLYFKWQKSTHIWENEVSSKPAKDFNWKHKKKKKTCASLKNSWIQWLVQKPTVNIEIVIKQQENSLYTSILSSE